LTYLPNSRACTKCGEVHPLESFRAIKNGKDGRHAWCRPCENVANRTYYLKRAERAREVARERYARQRDEILAKTHKYRAENPDASREVCKRWRAKNPEASRRLARERHARLKGAPNIEKIDRAYVFAREGGRCHICGKKIQNDITLDHLVPLSKGGDHTHANLRIAHRACNSSRGDGRLPAQLLLIA
jgi:5-methylcytosine-specific restriction endonuclease McrA